MLTRPLTADEVARLYAACEESLLGERDRLMLVLLFNCGLSTRELATLQRSYVDLDAGWLWAFQGQALPRPVPLNQRARSALGAWVLRPEARNLRYVLGRLPDGRSRVTARALNNRISAVGAAAGIPFSGAHGALTLAHRLATLDPAAHGFEKRAPLHLDALLPFAALVGVRALPRTAPPAPEIWRPLPAPSPELELGRRLLELAGEAL